MIVLGLTFKENCPDLRNSKVIDVIRELKSYGVNVPTVHDLVAESAEAEHEYGVSLTAWDTLPKGRCHRRRGRPQGIRRHGRRPAVREVAPGGVHRREEFLRPRRAGGRRREGLAAVSGLAAWRA